MKISNGLMTVGAAVLAITGLPAQAAMTCEQLATLALPDTTITVAQTVTGGTFVPPDGNPTLTGLPEFCRVHLTVAPQINVEVWLPTANWNGRFQAVGNGAWGGVIAWELGNVLKGGYATASTDTGHAAPGTPPNSADGSFGMLPSGQPNVQLQTDWSYRAVHEMTVKAKAVINAFYGSGPQYSYFAGCSGGGRQAMSEAERYPDDYDGIIAGAPAIHWDRYQATKYWMQVAQAQENGAVIPEQKKALATSAAVAACDSKDGVVDGILGDPRSCRFDAQKLVCKRGQPSETCLTRTEAAAINKMWDGPTDLAGTRQLWYGFQRGANLEGSGGPTLAATSVDLTKYWVYFDPNWDWHYLNYANFESFFDDVVRMSVPSGIATDDANLVPFRDSGGKLIMWHGWADQLIMPEGSPHYYDRVVKTVGGGYKRTQDFARLFMAPGVGHCGGGAGHTPQGQELLDNLTRWVEKGIPPEAITATRSLAGGGTSSRPLCAFPEVAEYRGTGSTDDAANFVCSRGRRNYPPADPQ